MRTNFTPFNFTPLYIQPALSVRRRKGKPINELLVLFIGFTLLGITTIASYLFFHDQNIQKIEVMGVQTTIKR